MNFSGFGNSKVWARGLFKVVVFGVHGSLGSELGVRVWLDLRGAKSLKSPKP